MMLENAAGLRVVLDTNVYISAFLYPARPISKILEGAFTYRYNLIVSPPIIKEIGETLREDFLWKEKEIIKTLKAIVKIAKIIAPKNLLSIVANDPDDNRILECAAEGKANLIVSGDHHLLKLNVYEGITIMRPTDFLRTLGVV